MKRELFGHRSRKKADSGRVPGEPYDYKDNEESDSYVEEHDFPRKEKGDSYGRNKDDPAGYEGKEHVKYKDPGHSPHNIRFPQDEPHMKSNNDSNESHEMEDNYHMDVPDQTHYSLEKKLKRARMNMDAPNQQDPKALRGNIVNNVGYKGEEDTSGEEEEGPNEMQSGMDKDKRKKMIVAVMKRKMKK
jgi:hypothetical protein